MSESLELELKSNRSRSGFGRGGDLGDSVLTIGDDIWDGGPEEDDGDGGGALG